MFESWYLALKFDVCQDSNAIISVSSQLLEELSFFFLLGLSFGIILKFGLFLIYENYLSSIFYAIWIC